MKILYNALILFLMLCFSLSAQSGVGKLSGKVLDSGTKEPLIGANFIILNSDWGAATNIDGEYFLLNIPPGTYDVKITYVGYAPKTIQGVRIVAGVTYDLNVELTTDFTLPDIVVVDKKFFEENATNTKKVIDSEEIGRLPVKGVEKLASLQSGVVISDGSGGSDGNATINVRGGRGGEVLYIVDGVPQNDLFTGTNYSQVSNAAIDQISFEIGGYEAKYGQAQSGIVNVTTKTGKADYSFYLDLLTSSFTDPFGYNLYTGTLGGPIIPSEPSHTFFFSFERGWFQDADPRSIGTNFPSIGYFSDSKKDNEASVYRFTGRTNHGMGDWSLRLGANINLRDYRSYIHSYAKSNSIHNPRNEESNLSFTGRLSQNVSKNAFWNLNLGYKIYNFEQGDGVWFNDLEAYGDSLKNATIGVTVVQGNRLTFDGPGIFALNGRAFTTYTKQNSNSLTGDFDFTVQLESLLLEFGGGGNVYQLRYYQMGTVNALVLPNALREPDVLRYYNRQPTAIGYDVFGNESNDDVFTDVTDSKGRNSRIQSGFAPKNPLIAYAYLQDRFELEDLVLNLGLRVDYFDTKTDIIKDPSLPYYYGDPKAFDAEDFVEKKSELKFSPRIGLGFPITASTVFHAQWGKFIQQPSLDQLYAGSLDYNALLRDGSLTFLSGYVNSEETTQYEVGFRHILGETTALNITAFYKNTRGLINLQLQNFSSVPGSALDEYYAPTNSDFGTVKGLAFSLDVSRISYLSLALDYTYSISEGTGSSTSSNFVAVFRNVSADRVPKVIAPLDFDQRHTGTLNLDFYIPENELGFFELSNLNILVSFSSGRPYTPLQKQNLLEGSSNWGQTKGYVNSSYGPGNFRVDFKLEKSIKIGSMFITPYLWIENLFDTENAVTVYRSTGSPYSTGFLETPDGRTVVEGNPFPDQFKKDYESLERNPFNFGIPRLIKLGLKVNFASISF